MAKIGKFSIDFDYWFWSLNAPSFSNAARLATDGGAVQFVLEGGLFLVAFFLALAEFTGMAKIGGYTMGPAVSNGMAITVFALGCGWPGGLVAALRVVCRFVLTHHCFE